MNKVSFEDVKLFTINELWALSIEITEDTCLTHDFNIGGLDGYDFMNDFSQKFNVDLKGFEWSKYFGNEGGFTIFHFFSIFGYAYQRIVNGKSARELVELPELTLGHLVKCANKGVWFEPKPHV